MFERASDCAIDEIEERRHARRNLLRFGIDFLDHALLGISPHDLIVIGAPPGIGKTELCCGIAKANMLDGKRVHYIALEAEPREIQRRLKYQLFAAAYFADPKRPPMAHGISYSQWRLGDFLEPLKDYEDIATMNHQKLQDLFIMYKGTKFGIADLIEHVSLCAEETDLIIVDHVHYFDFEDVNENKAIKEIAMTARTLALENGKPIILVSHLRKRDRQNQDLVAGIDEFHGSSDLCKIATKVITLAPGSVTEGGRFETFIRIPKNRLDGSVTRYLGRLTFSPLENLYDSVYKVGLSGLTARPGFQELEHRLYPRWAPRPG